jgi:FdhD protein
MAAVTHRKVLRIAEGEAKEVDDQVALDTPVELYIGNELFRTLWASPGLEREIAVGHMLAEGIIDSCGEVEEAVAKGSKIFVRLKTDRRLRLEVSKVDRMITTACGPISDQPNLLDRLRKPMVSSQLRLKPEAVLRMVEKLNRRASIFKATGGTHSAMLCTNEGEVHAYAEDVGRHNAIDKVIGQHALRGGAFSECVLISSGRQPSDMVMKAARTGIPIVVSQAAPLESGVKAAEEAGVTLICFARGRRFNVYAHPERVLLGEA